MIRAAPAEPNSVSYRERGSDLSAKNRFSVVVARTRHAASAKRPTRALFGVAFEAAHDEPRRQLAFQFIASACLAAVLVGEDTRWR